MDGSQHPKHTDASVVAKDVSDPFLADSSRDAASHTPETDFSMAKRQHTGDSEDPGSKRQHLMEADPEDLDLDALMAQLQRHTEQASVPVQESGKDTTESNAHDSQDPQKQRAQEPELSIEQQLKGALSSLQDLEVEGDEDDDNSDGEGAALALDQLSEFLNPQKHSGEQDDQNQEETSEHGPAQELDPELMEGTNANLTALGDLHASKQESSAAAETENDRPEKNALDARLASTESTSSDAQKDTSKKDIPTAPEHSNSRQALLARMPPPPPGASGTLPPMPPPPAALTSPTAPLTALELSRGAFQPSEGNRAGLESRALSSHLHRLYTPTFSEPPSLPNSYESALADQVDALSTKEGEPPQEEAHMALHLNDNQAVLQARQRSIPLLDSLAGQILDVLSFSHYQETLATVMQPESERGLAYRLLLDAFEDVKRLYGKWKSNSSRDKAEPKPDGVRPFLPHDIPGVEPTRQNIISLQRANLATFVAAIFGTIEIGFWELDKWFLKIFVPDTGRLLKQQANIYLDLKTQAYISAVEGSDDSNLRSAALEHLFPDDLEMQMKDALCERMILAPSEQDFVAKCQRRKENIKAENDQDLSAKYHWVPFLREVSDYISRNHYTLLPQRKIFSAGADSTVVPGTVLASSRPYVPPRKQPLAPQARAHESFPSSSTKAGSDQDSAHDSHGLARDSDVLISAVRANTEHRDPKLEIEDESSTSGTSSAAVAETGASQKAPGTQPSDSTTEQHSSSSKPRPDIPVEGHPLFPPLPKQVIPPPSLLTPGPQNHDIIPQQGYERSRRPGPRPHYQAPVAANSSADTLAVYEAAKASAEGTDAIRPKTSMFTTRRTWSKEEEEALLKGMDRVQGPYWAQILELYGPGGKISEVLKDRSQVQLKDKARNLKMFFLRLGLPIPAVFQYVTGDYETRRTSGKKVKERRQPRPGPSDLSHQTNSPVLQQRSAQHQSPTQVGLPLTEKSQPASGTGKIGLDESESANTRSSASPSPHGENALSDPHTAQSRSQEKPVHSLSKDSTPTLASENSQKESRDTSSRAEHGIATSTENHKDTPPRKEGEFLPNEAKDQQQGSKKVDLNSQTSHGDARALSQGSQSPIETNAEAGQTITGSNDNDGDDKEEDISALLNRMGEYVDNH